jgi:hypothetical protein
MENTWRSMFLIVPGAIRKDMMTGGYTGELFSGGMEIDGFHYSESYYRYQQQDIYLGPAAIYEKVSGGKKIKQSPMPGTHSSA